MVMPASLMFLQVPAVLLVLDMRPSTLAAAPVPLYQRSCVFRPSLIRMMILLYGTFGSMAGIVSGPPPTSECHAHTRPIGWLVLPFGVIESTRVFMAVQS